MSTQRATLPLLCLALTGCAAPPPVADAPSSAPMRHVASPDWRDQVIYFAMIDRFDDGDPGNNDQGAGEFDRKGQSDITETDDAGAGRARLDAPAQFLGEC